MNQKVLITSAVVVVSKSRLRVNPMRIILAAEPARDCLSAVALLISLYLSGCAGLAVPETPGTERTSEQLAARGGTSLLQVLITYNGVLSTHAAVRLEQAGRGSLFWDPAGLYGQADADEVGYPLVNGVQRHNDVIWERAPTLPTYWRFAETTGDTAMEVFEWSLSDAQAQMLYDTLAAGARLGGSNGFATDTSEPFCAIAVSDFLHRYGQGIVRVSESYLWPTSLAEQLRTQSPDRILIFSNAGLPMEYRGS